MKYITTALVLEEYFKDLEAIWDETNYNDLKNWLLARINETIENQQ